MNTRGSQRGVTLVVAIVLVVVFAVLGLALVSMHTTQQVTAGDHFSSSRALYLAESGLEWAARELFDAADPQADCEALAGMTPVTLGAGSFRIDSAAYDAGNVRCDIVSIGEVGQTRRRVTGAVRRAVLEGTSGTAGETIFGDGSSWTGGGTNINFEDGAIIFDRPAPVAKGKQPTQEAEATDIITDDFAVGDDVFFTGNFSYAGTMTGNTFTVEVILTTKPQITISCVVNLVDLSSPCGAVNDLNDHYNVVLSLGNTFSPAMVDRVRVVVDWTGGTSQQLRIDDACIGRIEHCTPDSGGDPVDPDTWEEVRRQQAAGEDPSVAAAP